jgi:3-(3-hydroxy-phenyl)propionate hydroxylase
VPEKLQHENPNVSVDILTVGKDKANIIDKNGLIEKHYDARPGAFYLIRSDQHIAARWRSFDSNKVEKALARVTGN